MAQNEWATLFASGAPHPLALRDALLLNTEVVLPTPEAVQATTLAPARAIKVRGLAYVFDAADTTSAHDGAAVLVSEDGRRYKLGPPEFLLNRVEAFTNTPPGSPSLGNAYLVGAAPSGAWATQANKVAIWTVNGWVFVAPANLAGRILYVAAEDASYQYTASGWRKGLGAGSLSDKVIWPNHLADAFGRHFTIENQTTNAPPGSPADGVAYIVGPSPTGAWAGQQAKVTIWLGGAWRFFTPAEGWLAFDRATDALYHFSGSVWTSAVGSAQSIRGIASAYAAAPISKIVGGINNANLPQFQYGYSDVTPPNRDQRRVEFTELAVTLQSTGANRKLRFTWDGFDPALLWLDPAFTPVIAIFRGTDSTALAWMRGTNLPRRIMAQTTDAASHTYVLVLYTDRSIGTAFTIQKNTSFSVEEIAA